MNWSDFVCGVWRRETIYRISFHVTVDRHCKGINGWVLDLCSGPEDRIYRHRIEGAHTHVVRADRNKAYLPDILVDGNELLPMRSEKFDAALLFNSIYILRDPEKTLSEIWRVLKFGGRCFVSSPFVFNESQDIHDYARYTREGLLRLFQRASFSQIEIHPFGERGSSAIYLLQPFFPFRVLRLFAYLVGYCLDALVPRRVRHLAGSPLGYFVVAQK